MRKVTTFGGGLLAVVTLSAVLLAQAPPAGGREGGGRGAGAPGAPAAMAATPVDPHDLGGFWQLPPDAREGRNVPDAVLALGVTKAKLTEVAKADQDAIRYCDQIGMPALMGLGTVQEIRISPQFMTVITEYGAAHNRWIYLSRATHPDQDAREPTPVGDSIGHWEGDTLVVDTVGFSDRGLQAIPGGGFRTPDSKLVERFKLLKNGQVLQVISTWTDPKVFKTPQTYEYRYNKVASTYEPHATAPCDPYDNDRVAFLAATAAKKIVP